MQRCHPQHGSINPRFLRELLSTLDLQYQQSRAVEHSFWSYQCELGSWRCKDPWDRNGEQNGKADLCFLREEIQNPDFLSLSSQPETLQEPLSSQQDLLPHHSQQESTSFEELQSVADNVENKYLFMDSIVMSRYTNRFS